MTLHNENHLTTINKTHNRGCKGKETLKEKDVIRFNITVESTKAYVQFTTS